MYYRFRHGFGLAALLLIGLMGGYLWALARRPLVLPKDRPLVQRIRHRRLPFAGARNFRDLGGYATADGATVRWGVLYRSDHLHHLTNRDLAALAALDLACVIDFRSDFEQTNEPDRLPPGTPVRVVHLPIFDANTRMGREIRERIASGKLAGLDPDAMLRDANVQFVRHFTPQFQAFVREVLVAQGKPVLFHCTVGKDRTGFAAAILLRILGVPQDVILQDYLESQAYLLAGRARDLRLLRLTRGTETVQIIEGLLSVKPEYLQLAFDTIEQEYGSFAAYVRNGLGLSDFEIAELRALLLES